MFFTPVFIEQGLKYITVQDLDLYNPVNINPDPQKITIQPTTTTTNRVITHESTHPITQSLDTST